jgi:hypothetical protein
MSNEPDALMAIGGPMHGKRIPDLGIRIVVPRHEPINAAGIGESDKPPTTIIPMDMYQRMALMGDGWSADVYVWNRKASTQL